MPDLPEALIAALADYYPTRGIVSPVTSTRGLAARQAALEKAYGGKAAAAARAAGVGPSTWRAWKAKGDTRRAPSATSARKVDQAYQHLLRAAKVGGRRAKPLPTRVDITAVVVADPQGARYKNSTPHRLFKGDQGVSLADVVRGWVEMRPAADLAADLQSAVAAAYGTFFAFEGDDVSVELK